MATEIFIEAPTEKFFEALTYSCHIHENQARKGTEKPYISHILGVASIVFEYGGTETEAIGGLLHDAIEDGKDGIDGIDGGKKIRAEDLLAKFGKEITDIVVGCTEAQTDPKPAWKERKDAYIKHLLSASKSVHIVSAADKLYNTRSILNDYRELGEELWTRFNATKNESLWYYRSLADIFKIAGLAPKPLIDELNRVVKKIEKKARG